jgi:Putative DNA-binding domain
MPTPAELERLLELPNESMSLEYKSWLNLTENHGRATLAKAAIALANHDGGIIVLGMRPDNDQAGALGSQPRPAGLGRYSQDLVNAAINRYADPDFHCELMFSAHPETGTEHAFVIVPGGMTVPVMSARDCEGVIAARRCYMRKPGPRSEEPLTGEEWRVLLDRCVRAGRESMLDAIRAIVQGRAGVSPPEAARNALIEYVDAGLRRWQEVIQPLPQDDPARMPMGYRELGFEVLGARPAPNLVELLRRIEAAGRIMHTGWPPFISLQREPYKARPINGSIETWLGVPEQERERRDAAHCDFWRAHPSGRLMLIRGYSEDALEGVEPGTSIGLTNPIWRIGEVMLFISRFARLCGENLSIVATCRCTGLRNRVLINIDGGWRHVLDEYRCMDDEVVLVTQATAAEIEDNLAEVLHPFLVPLYERFSFFELPMALVVDELARMRRGRF